MLFDLSFSRVYIIIHLQEEAVPTVFLAASNLTENRSRRVEGSGSLITDEEQNLKSVVTYCKPYSQFGRLTYSGPVYDVTADIQNGSTVTAAPAFSTLTD